MNPPTPTIIPNTPSRGAPGARLPSQTGTEKATSRASEKRVWKTFER
jgi:hypothetical protein